MNLFVLCSEALHAQSIESKLDFLHTLEVSQDALFQVPLPHQSHLPLNLQSPSYEKFCKIVHPTRIRRPKHIKSKESLAKLLHSIAHIEYSAIDLALDAIYRFRNLPIEYYQDWLEVALQERSHFALLRESLNALGYEYGDFEVHTQLFDASKATLKLDERMALLHRGLEASGLDSNPFIVEKIRAFEYPLRESLLKIFEIILYDEIEHVRKGDKWWKFANTNHSPRAYIELLQRFQRFCPTMKTLNLKARLEAGFSTEELTLLTQQEVFRGKTTKI